MGVICNDWRFGRRRIASPIKPALGGGVRGSNSCHGRLPEGICIVQGGRQAVQTRETETFNQSPYLHIMRLQRNCAVQYLYGWHAVIAWLTSPLIPMYTLEFNKKLNTRIISGSAGCGRRKFAYPPRFLGAAKKRHFPFACAETGDIETRAPEGLVRRGFSTRLGRGYGEIGRHARFRFWCRKAWEFKSLYPHQNRPASKPPGVRSEPVLAKGSALLEAAAGLSKFRRCAH